MKPISWRIIVGIVVIVIGGLALLQSTDLLKIGDSVWDIIIPAGFLAGGAAFLYVLIADKRSWWAGIPGFTLVGLSILIALSTFFPDFGTTGLPAAIFLAFIGVSFWVIYLINREHWWAIIPGGVLFSVAALVALSGAVKNPVFALFVGLGVTFGLVALLPGGVGDRKWAWIPAAVLFILGLLFMFTSEGIMKYIPAALMVVAGIVLIVLSLVRRKKSGE